MQVLGIARALRRFTHARIDKSIDEIEDHAFHGFGRLLTVDIHDSIRRIGKGAFLGCKSLPRINLKSAIEIDELAFNQCENLADVEFGDRLETIGGGAFNECTSLTHLKLPSIITIGTCAFDGCRALTDIELSEKLQKIERHAFHSCVCLQRIALPLKRDLFEFSCPYQKYTQFKCCYNLITVDIVGGTHKTIASLHMGCWRTEMIAEINQINQVLPNTRYEKTNEIQRWMEMVLDKLDHYKAEHYRHVKEGVSLLELALWKSKLDEKEESCSEEGKTKVKEDAEIYRRDKRVTCGADIVIKNVLPFLQLE